MTRLARGSIPSFQSPQNTRPPHADSEHSTLLSRGLISPTKDTSRPPSSSPKKKLRAGNDNVAMASSATSLLYACIAYDTTTLAEHTVSINASAKASQLVSILLHEIKDKKPTEARRSYQQKNDVSLHLLMKKPQDLPGTESRDGRLIFLVMAPAEAGKGVPYGFLENLQDRFFKAFDPRSTNFSDMPPLGCGSFNSELKKMMLYQGGTVAGQEDAIRTTQREINSTREIMTENIERLVERGGLMDTLVHKTSELGEHSQQFRRGAHRVKREMWWKDKKLKVLLVFVVIALVIALIAGPVCGLGFCSHH